VIRNQEKLVIIPLNLLESEDENMYQVTCASIRRAYQVTVTGDEELDDNNGKVVSTAIKQILTRTVQFKFDE
jgi:DNA-directed RNA polymerase subunit omega